MHGCVTKWYHYNDVIISAIASQITSLAIVYSSVYSGADQRKHQSSASQAFVRGIHRWSVNSPHKGPVTRKMFPFNDVIMACWQQFPWAWCMGSRGKTTESDGGWGGLSNLSISRLRDFTRSYDKMSYCPACGAFDLGLAVAVPLPLVTGIFVLLWFQSRLR